VFLYDNVECTFMRHFSLTELKYTNKKVHFTHLRDEHFAVIIRYTVKLDRAKNQANNHYCSNYCNGTSCDKGLNCYGKQGRNICMLLVIFTRQTLLENIPRQLEGSGKPLIFNKKLIFYSKVLNMVAVGPTALNVPW
jgi:hypothetical protein